MNFSTPPALPAWLIALRGAVVPVVGPNEVLEASGVESGLTEVARLRGELALVQARLVSSLAAMAGRDTSAAMSRGMGFSAREARDAIKVAGVVNDVAGAHDVDPAEQRMADALMELVDGEAGATAAGRAAVIVVVDPENLDAMSLGNGPLPFKDAADLAADAARSDVYAAVRDSSGAILRFGRSRRLATALQQLALAVRDRHCTAPGCEVPPQRCDPHHEPPFDDGGRTDVEWMTLRPFVSPFGMANLG